MKGAGKNPKNKHQMVRCPWCGKQPVHVKRCRLTSHLNPGGVKCFAIGQLVSVTPKGSS